MDKKGEYLDKIIEKICPGGSISEDDRPELEFHLENLVGSRNILLSPTTPGRFSKFEPGDLVKNLKTNEVGYIVGILNAWPRFTTDVIAGSTSRDPRYLTIILSPEHPDVSNIWTKTTGHSTTPKAGGGYFSVRYPRQSHLELIYKADQKNSEALEIKEYCSCHCILDCDETCPFYRHGFWKEPESPQP